MYPGCSGLVYSGYCDKHKKPERTYDKHRGSAHSRGYDTRWKIARISFLAENPFCAECLKTGKIEASEVVDHIKPHKGDMVLFWDKRNWQSLSKKCHDIKTAKEDGGFGNGR